MPKSNQTLVQGTLFDVPEVRRPARPPRPYAARHPGGRETRDPDVALAHEEVYRYAHSVKLGLARILATRSPEEKASLRALLAKSRVA